MPQQPRAANLWEKVSVNLVYEVFFWGFALSTIWLRLVYCCHFSTAAPKYFLGMLVKLLKWVSKAFGLFFAASVDLLTHCWNMSRIYLRFTILILFWYSGKYTSEFTELVPLPYCQEKCARYSGEWHDFCVTVARCYIGVYVNRFIPHRARPWNYVKWKVWS